MLHDEGLLTDVRTAVAGAIAAKCLAPEKVERIGIFGTGIQARLQLRHLKPVTPCADVVVWGRGAESLERYRSEMEAAGYRVETSTDPGRVARSANLIVTATPSREPLHRGDPTMTRSSPLRAFRSRLTARVRPGSARGLSEALSSLRQLRFPDTEPPSAWPCGPLILGSIPIERFCSEPRSGIIHIEVLGRAAGGTYNHSVAAA